MMLPSYRFRNYSPIIIRIIRSYFYVFLQTTGTPLSFTILKIKKTELLSRSLQNYHIHSFRRTSYNISKFHIDWFLSFWDLRTTKFCSLTQNYGRLWKLFGQLCEVRVPSEICDARFSGTPLEVRIMFHYRKLEWFWWPQK